jgi:deazaflavin-dependent oxidoreductase (nitroreductase family)
MSSNQQGPQIPADMKAFNAKLIEEFRANRGQMSGQMAGRQLLLLTTTGARSGEQRTAVVGYRPYGDDLAIIASDNGAPKAPNWFANLKKDPAATVEVGAEKFEVRTRVASPGEREKIAKLIEYLGPQQEKTSREIPIVILERV